jgi:hypothetical protein
MLTRPGVDTTWPKPVVIVLQVAAMLIAADLSFRYIERPIRSGGFVSFLRGASASGGRRRASSAAGRPSNRPVTTGAVLTGVLALVAVTLTTAPSAAPAGIQVDHSKQITIKLPSITPPSPTATSPHPLKHSSSKSPSASTSTRVVPQQPPFAAPVRVSFFGDSQGMTLLLNKPDGLQNAIITSDSTVEGCGVLLGTIHSRTGYNRDLSADCGSWQSQWADNAAKNNPQIAVVEIGAWDVFDDTIDGTSIKFGSSEWDAYFTKQMAKGIHTLIASGAQVALMGVPCYRPIAAGGLPLLPERGDDDRTRHLNTLLAAAAARSPQRVFMIHPPSAFCKNPTIAKSTAYRWDGTHYYKPGAALVFQVITPQLLAIPQPPPR